MRDPRLGILAELREVLMICPADETPAREHGQSQCAIEADDQCRQAG